MPSSNDSNLVYSPDRSENGKNFARKRRILPQKTVFWDRDNLLSKSVTSQTTVIFTFQYMYMDSSALLVSGLHKI
jgi:hypothetical protein